MKAGWRKLHLWLSLPLGLILTLVCWTGASMVFKTEIIEILNRPLYRVDPPTELSALTPSMLADKIRQQTGDSLHLTRLQRFEDPTRSALVYFAETGRRALSVDPYTGEIKGWTPQYAFFQTMLKMHRWLMDTPPKKGSRTLGKTLVGISAVGMLFILVSGMILSWPSRLNLWKRRFHIACRQGKRRFWYDSHVVLGFCACLFLIFMTLTGLSWAFDGYRTAAYRLFGVPPQTQTTKQRSVTQTPASKSPGHFDYTLWDRAWDELQKRYPTYSAIRLGTDQIEVTRGLLGTRKDRWLFSTHSEEDTHLTPEMNPNRARQVRAGFYAVHVGSWGGMLTKICYFLSALIGGMLPLSGYYLWWTRIRKASHPVASDHPHPQNPPLSV